jgi:lipid A 3-O-deacylase
MKRNCVHVFAVAVVAFGTAVLEAQTPSELVATNAVSKPEVLSQAPGIWQKGIGEGFRTDAQDITFALGANYGIAAFGSEQAHHLAIASLTYGRMLGQVMGEGHWYKGNPEFRLEAFTGAQFSPDVEWFVGLTPHLRYNFATGVRWVPFFDLGAGVTATGIGPPDLSGTFEFNLQAGGGVHYFLEENVAITLDVHYTHWSCGGIHKPNLGLNGVTGMLGMTFFF